MSIKDDLVIVSAAVASAATFHITANATNDALLRKGCSFNTALYGGAVASTALYVVTLLAFASGNKE